MSHVDHQLGDGAAVRLTFLAPHILRVQRGARAATGLNRYGFIAATVDPDVKIAATTAGDHLCVTSDYLAVDLAADGTLTVRRRHDDRLLLEQLAVAHDAGGVRVDFAAEADEDWLGFGDQTRERLYHRGHTADCYLRNQASYIPVPLAISTRGVAALVNSTHRVRFDLCQRYPDRWFWYDARGLVDYYVLAADRWPDLVGVYTDLTGKPKLPPVWAFGLWHLCRMKCDDHEMLDNARDFRREGIPCDVIGLEPGWMSRHYDLTADKDWHPERFWMPFWAPKGPHTFIKALNRMGFHLELWLCNDWDMSYEEERRIAGTPAAEIPVAAAAGEPLWDAEVAELDLGLADDRPADTLTKPDEPWFKHLSRFVDEGVSFFKQDGGFQVCDHPNRVWGNGMTDAEMHNLYPLLYSRQMYEGFANHTGNRPVVFTVAGWTGFQSCCGTWTGDTGGRLETLGGMLNTALCGHSWATNDMEVVQPEGVHFGYLQPWSQINSWAYFRQPWLLGESLLAMHRYYSRLRSRLIPYIYAWAWEATRSGRPLLAPLTFAFPDDPACRDLLHQYLLGRDLLVVIYNREAHFPAGRWRDWWTGEIVDGPCSRPIAWPADRGGGLYVREGALLPLGPVMQHRLERPLDRMELRCFPGPDPTTLTFVDDDGISLAWEDGDCAETAIAMTPTPTGWRLTIADPAGPYAANVPVRTWQPVICLDAEPAAVRVNGQSTAEATWCPTRKELTLPPLPTPVDMEVVR